MLAARPQSRTLQLLYTLQSGRAHGTRFQALTMADKMSTLSPKDAKVTSIEPMVSLYLETYAVMQAHAMADY